jgi:hypothetical protein
MSWHEKYIGISYEQKNCAELVCMVLRDELGLYTTADYIDGLDHTQSKNSFDNYSAIVCETGVPVDKCAVVLSHGLDQGHIGVVCMINNQPMVLHSMRGRGSSLQTISALIQVGYKVQGFYKWL